MIFFYLGKGACDKNLYSLTFWDSHFFVTEMSFMAQEVEP